MIRKKYQLFLKELQDNPRIQLLLDGTFNELKTKGGFALKPTDEPKEALGLLTEQESVYFQLENMRISWRAKEINESYGQGGFVLNNMVEALSSRDFFWKPFVGERPIKSNKHEVSQYEQLTWFQRQENHSDGRYGCFLHVSGLFPPPLVFFNKGWCSPLTLSFKQYLFAMFHMYAIRGWQFFYVTLTVETPYLDEAINEMKRVCEILPVLFPDRDWTAEVKKYGETLKLLSP